MSTTNNITIDKFVRITKSGTKQIINSNGYVLMRYKKIPKNIKFRHPAVNDYNQHLCGGWSVVPYGKFEEIERVVSGLKPLAYCHTFDKNEAIQKVNEIVGKGFLCTYVERKFFDQNRMIYDITASVKGKLGDYFDIQTLIDDYKRNKLIDQVENLERHKNVTFDAFHGGKFDVEFNGSEITGLILGYPIENTISLIKYS